MKRFRLFAFSFAIFVTFATGSALAAVGHGGPHLFHGKRDKSYSSKFHHMPNPKRRTGHSQKKARRHQQSSTAFASAPSW